ncbi:hypothetical protein B0H10DRAFT_2436149 [Mycena sp. CBHHK59/15]|nr:hypothetical protein B0H10DRAFT_2436149 [Mycena sp. CBHHK59/15]
MLRTPPSIPAARTALIPSSPLIDREAQATGAQNVAVPRRARAWGDGVVAGVRMRGQRSKLSDGRWGHLARRSGATRATCSLAARPVVSPESDGRRGGAASRAPECAWSRDLLFFTFLKTSIGRKQDQSFFVQLGRFVDVLEIVRLFKTLLESSSKCREENSAIRVGGRKQGQNFPVQ